MALAHHHALALKARATAPRTPTRAAPSPRWTSASARSRGPARRALRARRPAQCTPAASRTSAPASAGCAKRLHSNCRPPATSDTLCASSSSSGSFVMPCRKIALSYLPFLAVHDRRSWPTAAAHVGTAPARQVEQALVALLLLAQPCQHAPAPRRRASCTRTRPPRFSVCGRLKRSENLTSTLRRDAVTTPLRCAPAASAIVARSAPIHASHSALDDASSSSARCTGCVKRTMFSRCLTLARSTAVAGQIQQLGRLALRAAAAARRRLRHRQRNASLCSTTCSGFHLALPRRCSVPSRTVADDERLERQRHAGAERLVRRTSGAAPCRRAPCGQTPPPAPAAARAARAAPPRRSSTPRRRPRPPRSPAPRRRAAARARPKSSPAAARRESPACARACARAPSSRGPTRAERDVATTWRARRRESAPGRAQSARRAPSTAETATRSSSASCSPHRPRSRRWRRRVGAIVAPQHIDRVVMLQAAATTRNLRVGRRRRLGSATASTDLRGQNL
jgi:hypothetical protein